MKNNSKLQKDVQDAISWEPAMHAATIGVTANDGAVTFSGTVDSYTKKISAERAAKNVMGVRAVAEDINVDYGSSFKNDDTKLAIDVLEAWKNNWEVPINELTVKVEDGWVNLEGEVPYKFHEEKARQSIEHLRGIKGVLSLVKIKSSSEINLERMVVENALNRNWSIDTKNIKVEVNHDDIKLSGVVHSLYQKEEAGRLAWNSPGVRSVENVLAVVN